MNVHHLQLFFYVAKYEGITSAVRKMPYGIQQPAVSGQLLQLEESLGVKLFNRRPFAMTKAGEELYDFIYPFFSKLPQIESQLKGEESNTLRIAASATTLKTHLPIVLGVLKREIPDLKLSLNHVEPSEIMPLLQAEEIDLALTVVSNAPDEHFKWKSMLSLPVCLIVPEAMKVQKFEDLLELDEYEKGQVITPDLVGLRDEDVLAKSFSKFCEKKNIQWESSVKLDSLEVIQDYVLEGFGIGLGLDIPGRKLAKGLRSIRIPDFPPLELGVLYQGKLKPIATQFLSKAEEAASVITAAL